MRYICILTLLFAILVLATSCYKTGGDDFMFEKPLSVKNIPSGYIEINKVREQYEGLIGIFMFESQVAIYDLEPKTLSQFSVSQLLRYRGKLYINEDEIIRILPQAEETAERLNRIYNVGEPIEMLSKPRYVTVTVVEVSYADSYEHINLRSDEWVCIVKISIETDFDRRFQDDYNIAWKYFDYIETVNGQGYIDVLEDDSDQMVIRLPIGEKAKILHLKSPTYQDIGKRKVDISQ